MNRKERRSKKVNSRYDEFLLGVHYRQIKKEIKEEVTRETMTLTLALPILVLKEYWPKTYEKKIPGFVDKVLGLYSKWEDGEITTESLKQELWDVAGVRFEIVNE